MAALTIHDQNPEAVIATAPGLLIAAWAGAVSAAQVSRLDGVIGRLVSESADERYCSLTIIEPSISMRFEEDARARSTALQKRWGEHMRAQAYLVEGSGFLPATVRTVTAGLHLVTRAPHPLRVFGDAHGVVEWLAPIGSFDPDELSGHIAEVRAGVGG